MKKHNRPVGVRREHWEAFVDMYATAKDQKIREIGKESRKQVKVLHTTGKDALLVVGM